MADEGRRRRRRRRRSRRLVAKETQREQVTKDQTSRQRPASVAAIEKQLGQVAITSASASDEKPQMQAVDQSIGVASSLGTSLPASAAPDATYTISTERASNNFITVDLLRRIFDRLLGLPDVLQCRLVCKLWHLSVGDIDHIWRTLCCLTPLQPVDNVFWLRPEVQDMHVCPGSAAEQAGTGLTGTCWQSSFSLPPNQHRKVRIHCKLVASAHGLLCLQLIQEPKEWGYSPISSLIVCNPVARTHKVLPQLTCIEAVESIGMHYSPVTKSYIIIAMGTGETGAGYFHDNGNPVKKPFYISHVEIYHSEKGFWEYHSHFITDTQVKKGNISWWQGQFHLIVLKPGGKLQLLAYDMATKQWVDSKVRALEIVFSIPVIFPWRDLLVCEFKSSVLTRISTHWKLKS
ncbi:hypothetical protein GOP47_0011982 [Adiantum capillus-veneris]|uniref:F-box domain-containing protein n=1 Tax=Adiantum capillus-veneris TaxID=13818 RepID=A0A9D4UTS8_ADICA|nr:hypothetical protein GOP47_0011982 [Adiantum capillus-veneris]